MNEDIFYDTRKASRLEFVDKGTILGDAMIQLDLYQSHPVLGLDKGYSLNLAFTNILTTEFESPSEVLSVIDPHKPPSRSFLARRCLFARPVHRALFPMPLFMGVHAARE